MANLTSQSLKDTYKDLIHVFDANSASQGFSASLKPLYDGAGNSGPFSLSATTLDIPIGNTLNVDGTFSGTGMAGLGLPTQTSNAGKYLVTDGTDASWDEVTSIGILTGATPLEFEGATANSITTKFNITEPTVDRTLTFPNATGTVALEGIGVSSFTNDSDFVVNNPQGVHLNLETEYLSGKELQYNGTEVEVVGHTHTALTGVIQFDNDGTYALPNIVRTGDVTTGIYFPTTSTIGFTVGGTRAGFIQAGGSLEWDAGASFGGDVQLNDADLVFEGATANAYETTLTVTDPTADRTITLPNETGTVLTSVGGSVATLNITNSSYLASKSGTGKVLGHNFQVYDDSLLPSSVFSWKGHVGSKPVIYFGSDDGTDCDFYVHADTLITFAGAIVCSDIRTSIAGGNSSFAFGDDDEFQYSPDGGTTQVFVIEKEGTLRLKEQASAPTATDGGFYYDGTNLFLGKA